MPKRANHEGTIRKRRDGRWEAMISLPDGKRKSVYSKTQREVRQRLAAAHRDIQQGLPAVPERQTLGQYLAHWLENAVKPTVRPRTYASYADLVRLHIAPSLGHRRLSQLTPQDVQSFLNGKVKQGLSPSTVKYLHALLRRALGQALKWGLLARNVAALVDPPRVRRPEIKPFTTAQGRTFLEAIRGNRQEALYSVALAVGLRQGEALGLRWEDVDLDTGTLRVRVQLQRIDGKFELVEPKTERSTRTIALPPIAVDALRDHRVRQLEERLLAGSRWQEWGLVFPTTVGTPLDAKNVTHRFQALLERVGLPRMRFHDLRHACASLLLAQGASMRELMDVLGHDRMATTSDIYAHVAEEARREVAARMELALRGSLSM